MEYFLGRRKNKSEAIKKALDIKTGGLISFPFLNRKYPIYKQENSVMNFNMPFSSAAAIMNS